MKFIDMFAGMGTARMAFEQAGHECVYSIEWDKHKRKIYEVIFGHEPSANDINRVRGGELPRADIWTAGFPCQDISVAGKQAGFRGHRSSLFFQVTRLIREMPEEDRPSYLLFENVKNFFSVNRGYDFLTALIELDEIGYDVEWQLLNTKYHRVPQNRERVFLVGHFRGRSTRKIFPISGQSNKHSTVGKSTETAVARTLTCGAHSGGNHSGMTILQIKQIGNCMPRAGRDNPNEGRVYDTSGISPCLNKMEGGGRQPFVIVPEATKKGYAEAYEGDSINLAVPGSQTRRGREGKGVANTLDTSCNQGTLVKDGIRRLTPKECMRLQGVPDYITDKLIAAGISDTQLYRAAGDAWTVNVGYEIARRMG